MSPIQHRAQKISEEIDGIIRETMPKLIKLGHLRRELELLLQEAESYEHQTKP